MNDLIELHAADQLVHGRPVGEIAVREFEGFGQGLKVSNVGLLELRIVKSIQIVESPNRVAGKKQRLANMRADKTCPARHQEIHTQTLAEAGESCRIFLSAGFPHREGFDSSDFSAH